MNSKLLAALKELKASHDHAAKYNAPGWCNNLLIWPQCERLVKLGYAQDRHGTNLFTALNYRITQDGIDALEALSPPDPARKEDE